MRRLLLLTTVCLLTNVSLQAQDHVLTSSLSTEGGTLLDIDRGTTGLWQQLLKLSTTGSLLHTIAHPDDEHAGMLTYMSRGAGARTALLTLNRGEAGANAIGPELFDGLGLIRTEELRLSDRYYGLDDQYYSSVLDYGYSKTLDETLRSWDTERVLSDMVRVIRMNRPLVVVSRFHGSERDGHGNHQAVGGITPEAVGAAADPTRFPEQLTEEGLRPWQVKKLYRGGVRQNEPHHLELNFGQHSPWLGDSYHNIGYYGLSLQRSQTSGRTRSRMGPVPYYYERLTGNGPESESGFFDGLDVSLTGLFTLANETPPDGATSLLEQIAVHVANAMQEVHPSNPTAITQDLTAGLAKTRTLLKLLPSESEAAFMLRIKEQQFEHAIATALGIKLSAIAQPPGATPPESFWLPPVTMGPVVRGQTFDIDARLYNPSDVEIDDVHITLEDPSGLSHEDWKLVADASQSEPFAQVRFTATVPDNAPISRPYYHRNDVRENHYEIRDVAWQHMPSRPASLRAHATFSVMGEPVLVVQNVQTREANLPYGYAMRKLQVLPALAVNVSPAQRVVLPTEGGSTFSVAVEVINNIAGGTDGSLSLNAPEGWAVSPALHTLNFAQAGERAHFSFEIQVPALSDQEYEIVAMAETNGTTISEGYDVIRHRDMETRYLFKPAISRVRGLEVGIAPDLSVGYVMGVGDNVPSGIEQLGARMTLLQEPDLASSTLEEYDVIVIGTRAYAVRQDLHTYNRRLMDYASNGGNLIVLYQTQEFIPEHMAPYPASLPRGAEEVSEEDAPVAILAPDHVAITSPNVITLADFEGWVEQRGSKFFTEWDDAYTPLVETHDTGQDPQAGVCLVAEYGQGHYTYCALAFHRQLPYAVAGAYRLFANLLSM